MLLSLAVLGNCRTARLLAEDKASDADLSGVHSIDLGVLQKLTDFPNCIASCALGAPLWLQLTAAPGLASTRIGYRVLFALLSSRKHCPLPQPSHRLVHEGIIADITTASALNLWISSIYKH